MSGLGIVAESAFSIPLTQSQSLKRVLTDWDEKKFISIHFIYKKFTSALNIYKNIFFAGPFRDGFDRFKVLVGYELSKKDYRGKETG